ncbi:MAG: TRAP transporter large permease subunit [Rhodobacteraceae bacterium]|nr:TRAP transporter large permease subunit [Paracoccaceae bacterium]
MLFGLDGVEVGLIIVFTSLFIGIMSGFPVAFSISGAAVAAFGILAALDNSGVLLHAAIDTRSEDYVALVNSGIARESISIFRYPDLPTAVGPLFENGWQVAMDRNISFIVNRMNERVFAGQSIETLLAVLMFVLMGVTLERSKIAEDLLTTMARVFGPLPGGLAVSVVLVGAFLAASTGIVGATVVTMGLLSLPTMLRNGYSPELATGVIAASGTLGQIIPPSIVIVLLGTLAGDLYAAAQEKSAQALGCTDALTYLGHAAVLSVGTLFKAALLPGIMLAFLYGLYAFGYALVFPHKAPPIAVTRTESSREGRGKHHGLIWFLGVPVGIIVLAIGMASFNIAGNQTITVLSVADIGEQPELRTNVSEQCQAAMIDKHGIELWDESVAKRAQIDAAGGTLSQADRERTPEQMEEVRQQMIADTAPIGTGLLTLLVFSALIMASAFGIAPLAARKPFVIGVLGILAAIMVDVLFLGPTSSSGRVFLLQGLPFAMIAYAIRKSGPLLGKSEVLKVVFPPLVLIIAVLGSILGGITNPTPAAALGAAGAILLAAYRKLGDEQKSGKVVIWASFALMIMLLVGINFDLRTGIDRGSALSWNSIQSWIAILVAQAAYLVAMGGLFYACFVLWRTTVLSPVVRETAKVTSMVFAILIGSQMLNLVIISFGGEHYIQQFLQSFDDEMKVFLIVMVVLFILGFVLDFLEIIYIVVPIVGPVIYGGTMDPSWVTIMIAVNLQTSFLTPPFGFALFYLRGVAPKGITTGHIYRGVVPFVLIQVGGLALLWYFPWVVTIVPNLLS